MRPIAAPQQEVKWIHSNGKCGPSREDTATRTRDTARNLTPLRVHIRSSFITFNTVLPRLPTRVRRHVIKLVPIAYISYL
jgi:hypothetical protein